jgi:hypothetical protein
MSIVISADLVDVDFPQMWRQGRFNFNVMGWLFVRDGPNYLLKTSDYVAPFIAELLSATITLRRNSIAYVNLVDDPVVIRFRLLNNMTVTVDCYRAPKGREIPGKFIFKEGHLSREELEHTAICLADKFIKLLEKYLPFALKDPLVEEYLLKPFSKLQGLRRPSVL